MAEDIFSQAVRECQTAGGLEPLHWCCSPDHPLGGRCWAWLGVYNSLKGENLAQVQTFWNRWNLMDAIASKQLHLTFVCSYLLPSNRKVMEKLIVEILVVEIGEINVFFWVWAPVHPISPIMNNHFITWLWWTCWENCPSSYHCYACSTWIFNLNCSLLIVMSSC